MEYRKLDYNNVQGVIDAVYSGANLQQLCDSFGYNIQELRPIVFPGIKKQAPNGKLPIRQLRELKEQGLSNVKLARHFGSSKGTIRRALKHKDGRINVFPTNGQHPTPKYNTAEERRISVYRESAAYQKQLKGECIPSGDECLSEVKRIQDNRTNIVLSRVIRELGTNATLSDAWNYLCAKENEKDFAWLCWLKESVGHDEAKTKTISDFYHEIRTGKIAIPLY